VFAAPHTKHDNISISQNFIVIMKITELIRAWMADSSNNFIEPGSTVPAFAEPLVGISSGRDDLFTFLKTDIGPDHYWTPQEAFSLAYPEEKVNADELSVIAWILPQTKETRQAHRKADRMPSIEWSKSRYYGEKVNENLRTYVVELFADKGIQACAPVLLPQWSQFTSDRYGFASCWSERHTAHVCGLGTFGLSDGLITPVGKAVRVGSVIVRKKLSVTPRTYKSHNEWCLRHSGIKCIACIKRCPVGAISESGHDKVKCKHYTRTVTSVHVENEQLGFKVNSCGLCQTKIPCEYRRPIAGKKKP
jgi:epoxyqueuosine reductase